MHLTLHLGTACNMRCDYCYAPPHPGPVMTEATAAAALELGRSMGEGPCGIVFFGGEPLLHRELIQATVTRARVLERDDPGRFHCKLTTNGLLLDADFLEYSLREQLLIAMSLDGVAPAHDAHRRLPDGTSAFPVLRERLRLLLAHRPYASILMVVNPDTARWLVDSVTWLLDEGARYLIISLNHAAPWSEEDLAALERQYRKLARRYVRWTRQERRFYLSPFEVKLSSHINRHCYQRHRCELAQRQLSVDPEGYLFPCVQFTRAGHDSEWCLGHVTTGVDEERRQALHARSRAEKEPCSRCAIRERCNHTCGCLNWQATGSVNGISPVLCRSEQMLVRLADRIGRVLYRRRDPHFLHKHYNAAYPVLSLLEERGSAAPRQTAEG